MQTALTAAQQLDQWGFNVLPAAPGGKAPIVGWKEWQDRRTSDRLAQWFRDGVDSNLWVLCGRVSQIVVLDVDSPKAEQFWRERLGAILDDTVASQTRKGVHYWFRIGADEIVPSWSVAEHTDACEADPDQDKLACDCHDTELFFDVRAEGTGIIAPGSVHKSGFRYEWIRSPEEWDMVDLPVSVRNAAAAGLQDSTGASGSGTARSMLAKLLSEPPSQGGRNIWLSRVAGHYAKMHRNMRDLYEVEVQRANAMMSPPLSDAEFTKTVESIWTSEQAKHDEQAQDADEDNGWLISADTYLVTPVRFKQGEEWVVELRQWANFDIRALGVVEDDQAERTYDVQVHRKRQGDSVEALLPAKVLSDARRLDAWLAEFGVGITPPTEKEMTKTRATVRLQSYIESQSPPHFQVVQALGWHGDGFVCHEGVIRADGLHGFSGIKPDPILRNRAPWAYGFVDEQVAREVLNEVLTFHHPTVASVFGAWWAACLLKPQLQAVSSQFPFMALEAPSESGKTTGMFSKLIQLGGNQQGQTSYTPASLRNAIAAHHSGTVWIDDEDSLDHLMQLLRMATGEGSYTKMGEDHHSSVTVQLVAPILVSGEALQMGSQKALRDRAVMLQVPTPTGRKSIHDPSRPQWDDVVALSQRFPDLSVMAGTMVQMALQNVGLVDSVKSLRGSSSKRFGDKIAILRVGARVLAQMTGDPGHVDTVDQWVDEQDDLGSENALTLKVLPEVLAALQWPTAVEPGYNGQEPTPVIVRNDDEVWFSPTYLAMWWKRNNHGRIEQRTESKSAFEQQSRAMGLPFEGGHSRLRVPGSTARPSYWMLPADTGRAVLKRSWGMGDSVTEVTDDGTLGLSVP